MPAPRLVYSTALVLLVTIRTGCSGGGQASSASAPVAVTCSAPARTGVEREASFSNARRTVRFTGPKGFDHRVDVDHATGTRITLQELAGSRRGVEITRESDGNIPVNAVWGRITIDATGCDITSPGTTGITKDGVWVEGSSYDRATNSASGRLIGNSAYMLATPG
jgi:hypothetical protein